MTGAAGVAALVLIEWVVGTIAVGAWSQSWGVIKRGQFRIVAWSSLLLVGLSLLAVRSAEGDEVWPWALATAVTVVAYLAVQYSRTDLPGIVVGAFSGIVGSVALMVAGAGLAGWPDALAALELLGGALLLGAVTNGMLLGHWYLNQPGLKPWALGRLSDLCLIGVGVTGVLGLVAAPRLAGAETEGAVLGLPGFGESFGVFFFVIWIVLLAFTGVVSWMARRCVLIRSIQSATGLFYVAILTAGVAEFLIRYLMVNAS